MAASRTRQRNPRGSGSRLRQEIIDAATRLIDEGVDPLTLRGVAAEAGIAAPSVYDHFRGIDAIRNEVIRAYYRDLIAEIEIARGEAVDEVDGLLATCATYVALGAKLPHRYALVFRAVRDEKEKRAVGDSGMAALRTLVDGIADCARTGRSGSEDPGRDAVALWSAIHGLTTLRASRPHFHPLQEEEMLRCLVLRLARIADPP